MAKASVHYLLFAIILSILFLNLTSFSSITLANSHKEHNIQDQQSESLQYANELNQQVISLYREGHYDEAISLAEQISTIIKKIFGPDHPEVAKSFNKLAL